MKIKYLFFFGVFFPLFLQSAEKNDAKWRSQSILFSDVKVSRVSFITSNENQYSIDYSPTHQVFNYKDNQALPFAPAGNTLDISISRPSHLNEKEAYFGYSFGNINREISLSGRQDIIYGKQGKVDVSVWSGQVELPKYETTFNYWFRFVDNNGQIQWLSQYGKNYQLQIIEIDKYPLIVFYPGGETVYGTLAGAKGIRIAYNLDRVPNDKIFCRFYKGAITWNLYPYWFFKSETGEISENIFSSQHLMLSGQSYEIFINTPEKSQEISLFFKAVDYCGNRWFDSSFDKNFRFSLF